MLGDGGFRRELENARAAELVDYPAVWRLKLRVLELLFASFQRRHLAASTERALAFRSFPCGDGRGARAACRIRCAA